ncbi:hypothetical protein LTR97_010698 [Elasticomyces elasticus]|uniref:BTB domain-containing protein n=1 Tax=Elasticomyces elasticus TaxID=574655 RepID=A0AAN7ZR81_9PEZI|nr:hypothetical protein LTR97_010698 [Elasticomyces elasticus]
MAAIEVDIPQLSPVPTPTNTTLAEDGDVILILWHESILHERIRVSSAILSAASPVFKAMLGPHFQEGQQARSAERPREIELPEDGAYGMEIMLQWLHGNVDEAFGDDGHPCCVAHVAVHLDKYGCPRSFSLIGEALLKRCAEACTARCSGDDEELFETVAWSAKAAYLLKSSDLFTQFTRRLILDGTEPFSNIPKLAAGEQMPNKEILPVTVLLGMEEQRNKACNLLLSELSRFTESCLRQSCTAIATSTTFTLEMAHNQEGERWPPLWAQQSLRSVLQGLDAGGDIVLGQTVSCNHKTRELISRVALTAIRKTVEAEVYGMCFTCARQDKMQSTCEHTAKLKRRAARPLFV